MIDHSTYYEEVKCERCNNSMVESDWMGRCIDCKESNWILEGGWLTKSEMKKLADNE